MIMTMTMDHGHSNDHHDNDYDGDEVEEEAEEALDVFKRVGPISVDSVSAHRSALRPLSVSSSAKLPLKCERSTESTSEPGYRLTSAIACRRHAS